MLDSEDWAIVAPDAVLMTLEAGLLFWRPYSGCYDIVPSTEVGFDDFIGLPQVVVVPAAELISRLEFQEA